jgi:2-dehydropantoate 2-reductase
MKYPFKILFAGIGGVGGYFGGKLALYAAIDPTVEVSFLARGEHLKAMQKNGLEIKERDQVFIAHPSNMSEDAAEFGIQDVVFLCCKSYDLDKMLEQIHPCIGPHTLLIPLLNGVQAREKIRLVYPNQFVCDACVYIVSQVIAPGKIHNSGNIERLFFGNAQSDPRMDVLVQVLLKAGIDAHLREDIETVVWEKFIFLSPTANATTYFKQCLGNVLEVETSAKVIKGLLNEIIALALQKGIVLPESIYSITLEKMKALPYSTTSSMQRDAEQNKKTEVEVLTQYVLQEAAKFNVEVPFYKSVSEGLNPG